MPIPKLNYFYVTPLQSELPNRAACYIPAAFSWKAISSNALSLIYSYFLGISLSGLALESQVSLSSLISIVAKSSSIKDCLKSSGEKF